MREPDEPPYASTVADYPSEEYQAALMRWAAWKIWKWKDEYYNGNGSSADDALYDLWWNNLLFLEKTYPHLIDYDSPTEGVGARGEV